MEAPRLQGGLAGVLPVKCIGLTPTFREKNRDFQIIVFNFNVPLWSRFCRHACDCARCSRTGSQICVKGRVTKPLEGRAEKLGKGGTEKIGADCLLYGCSLLTKVPVEFTPAYKEQPKNSRK